MIIPISIVLYNPSAKSLERILSLSETGIIFYLYDNSKRANDLLVNKLNISYFHSRKNMGLSFGMDFLMRRASEDKFNRLLFFDQDTSFNESTYEFVLLFNSFICNECNVLFDDVVAVNFKEKAYINPINVINVVNKGIYTIYETYFIINSGTLFFLNKLNIFNWFCSGFFVDGVDYAFAIDARINGLRTLSITNVPALNHTDEQGDHTLQVFGKILTSRVYPVSRNVDFLKSHGKLFLKSLTLSSSSPKIFILRAIISYICTQLIFRLNKSFKIFPSNE